MNSRVFLIDDDETLLKSLGQWLRLSDFEVTSFASAQGALMQLTADFDGVIVSDVKMPGLNGLELMQAVQAINPEIPIVLMTGHGDVALAVDAMKQGAYDFLEKPFAPERLGDAVKRGLENHHLRSENRSLKNKLASGSGLSRYMIGESSAIRELRAELVHLAATDVNVLILGETGTGKELAARALHDFSLRADKTFHAVNCGAIPDDLFESELFGHKAGAFTGATEMRKGAFEFAEKGTLFLDELTSLPLSTQVKLLRVIQERKVQRLGTNALIDVDVRLIAAANEDIKGVISDGRFRDDLYYRINTIELTIPPLRERIEDIPLLFEYFLNLAEKRFNRKSPDLNAGDLAGLSTYHWPGNVRELRNVAERFTLMRPEAVGGLAQLINNQMVVPQGSDRTLADQVADFERSVLVQSLSRHDGSVAGVIEELGVPRRTLSDKMQRYGLSRSDFEVKTTP